MCAFPKPSTGPSLNRWGLTHPKNSPSPHSWSSATVPRRNLKPCFATCALAAAIVAAALGSTKPHPVFPFCKEAASAEQIPTLVVPISAQQADSQSASEVHPPVVNCKPLPFPTSLAPALLGARASEVAATYMSQ